MIDTLNTSLTLMGYGSFAMGAATLGQKAYDGAEALYYLAKESLANNKLDEADFYQKRNLAFKRFTTDLTAEFFKGSALCLIGAVSLKSIDFCQKTETIFQNFQDASS